MAQKSIYLDYAATTPVDKTVLSAMKPYFTQKFGNAMSVHSFGRTANEAVDKARAGVAAFLNCEPQEVIFTSGATESNNLALRGIVKAYYIANKQKPHIITTTFEHHCVLTTCQELEKEGLIEASYLNVNKDGVVKIADVAKALKSNTILVSIMYVNNEIGTVQPIAKIGQLIQAERAKFSGSSYPLFHTDATQAVNYFNCDVKNLGIDLLSLSAHKIYGPKGTGVLFVKKNTPLKHTQSGGDQEYKLRAGTHNVPGIVGLGKAIAQISNPNYKLQNKSILKLRDYLIKKVLKEIPKSYLNGSLEKRSPNNANFRFDDVEGESLILALDMEGIAGSTGSACSSGSLDPSHVLLALGLKHEQAHGSLRLTLGKDTTKENLDYVVKKLKEIIKRLRSISGNVLGDFNKK